MSDIVDPFATDSASSAALAPSMAPNADGIVDPFADNSGSTKQASGMAPEPADHGLSERQKLTPIGKALSPITSYPETYNRMRNEAGEMVESGLSQATHPDSLIDPQAHGLQDVITGVGKAALGAASYVASPVSAAYRSVVGQPVEDVTGIPREYTEFAAQLATPGIGLTGAVKKPAVPTTIPKPVAPTGPFDVVQTEGEQTGNLALRQAEQGALRGQAGEPAQAHAEEFLNVARPQQLQAAKDTVATGLDPVGNQNLATTPTEAAGFVQKTLRKEDARSKAQVKSLYDQAKALPGEIDANTFRDMPNDIKTTLSNRPESVIVDEGTPVASRMINYLNDRIGQLNIRNLADPNAPPDPQAITGVNLEGVEQWRKNLSRMRSDAIAAYHTNPSDARAAGAIIDEFDNRIQQAVNSGAFTGDPRAVDLFNSARAAHAVRMQQWGNDAVGRRLKAIIGDYNRDPATLNDVANYLYGASGSSGSLNVGLVKRVKNILGDQSPEWAAVKQGLFHRIVSTAEDNPERGSGAIANRLNDFVGGKGSDLANAVYNPAELSVLKQYGAMHRQLAVPQVAANWPNTAVGIIPHIKTASDKVLGVIGAFIGHHIMPFVGDIAGWQAGQTASKLIDRAENNRNLQKIAGQMPLVTHQLKQWQKAVTAAQRQASIANQSKRAIATTNLIAALDKLGISPKISTQLLQGAEGPGTADAQEKRKGYADGGSPTFDDDGPDDEPPAPTRPNIPRVYIGPEPTATAQSYSDNPVPETKDTLQAQQQQLVSGNRDVQLFPQGQDELNVPKGMQRAVMPNGDVFHYNPDKVTNDRLLQASADSRENEVLGLGPVSKDDAMQAVANGAQPVSIVERKPDGTEVRAAAGTDQTAPDQVAALEANKSKGDLVQIEDPKDTILGRLADTQFSPGTKIGNRLTGLGGEQRYQTWPERMIRSGLTIAGDVLDKTVPVMPPGLRREDFTDQPPPNGLTVAAQPNDPMMERAQDMAGLAGSGGLGASGMEDGLTSATLGSTPMLRPALRYQGKIYKAPVGGQHLDAIPASIYPEFQRQAMNGEDISNFDFGFMNHKGQFLDRQAALDYAVKEGLINPHDANQGALTTSILSNTSTAGAPLAALEHAQPFYSAVEKTVQAAPQQKMQGIQWANWLKNQSGVKPDEMQYTGLDNWLREQKGPVTKQQVADYIDKNQVRVNDTVKGQTEWKDLSEKEQWRWRDFYNDNDKANEYGSFANYIAENFPRSDTKYQNYQLPGGTNYREHLITLPEKVDPLLARAKELAEQENGKGSWDRIGGGGQEHYVKDARREFGRFEQKEPTFRSSHWDEPNILAHVRTNERDVGGVPALHLEELQSDWGQKIRKNGVKQDLTPAEKEELEDLYKRFQYERISANEAAHKAGLTINEWNKLPDHEMVRLMTRKPLTEVEKTRFQELGNKRELGKIGAPDMPFKQTDQWATLALKRMIQKAVAEGKSRISWTPGEVQASRYDLSKHFDEISAQPSVYNGDPSKTWWPKGKGTGTTYGSIVTDPKGNIVQANAAVWGTDIIGKNIADVVGKDIAEKGLREGAQIIKGLDLKVGGEGMKGFYDQMLPKMVEKLGKQYGIKVKEGTVPNGEEKFVYNGPNKSFEELLDLMQNHANKWTVTAKQQLGAVITDVAHGTPLKQAVEKHGSPILAEHLGGEMTTFRQEQPVKYFDIPDKMREDVLKKGFPLFSDSSVGAPLAALEHEGPKSMLSAVERARAATPAGTYTKIAPKDKQAEAIEGLSNYFDMLSKFQPKAFGKYSGTDHFVATNGIPFFANDKTFAGARQTAHECFKNAALEAIENPDRTYVEGYVSVHGVPIHHAWTVDHTGQIYDQTIVPKGKENLGYFGVPFSDQYLMKSLVKNKVYGLLGYRSRKTLQDLYSGKKTDFKADVDPDKLSDDVIADRLAYADKRMNSIPMTDKIDTPERNVMRQHVVDTLYNKDVDKRVRNREATIVLGLPGAGKSTFINPLLNKGALEIEGDNAKAMLPEFKGGVGAWAVHEEGSNIMRRVLKKAVGNGDNIVWPRIDSPDKIAQDVQSLKQAGYKVNVKYINTNADQAADSAIRRYLKGGRYVSPEMIQSYGDASRQSYQAAKGTGLLQSSEIHTRDAKGGFKKIGE